MTQYHPFIRSGTRRYFVGQCGLGLGTIALSSLLRMERESSGKTTSNTSAATSHGSAKNIIFLHMNGGPPQQDLFEWYPRLSELHGQAPPDSLVKGLKFPFLTPDSKLLATPYKFSRKGECGAWMSELLPHLGSVVDEVTFLRAVQTEHFNHAPANLYMFTGSSQFNGASLGAWVTYGIGSENENLPGFIVLISGEAVPQGGKSLWGNGFLPARFQGVRCRSGGDPILFVSDPPGISREVRRQSLDTLKELNEFSFSRTGDEDTLGRIEQYELAFRMQVSVPEIMDISREPQHIQRLYGTTPGVPSFANNCLLARRLIEDGVRFVQLSDYGWDLHGDTTKRDLMHQLPARTQATDQAMAALITDLKQRGLLAETLVVWGGEFGRTSMNEGSNYGTLLGRDHQIYAFTMWVAGGGVRSGFSYGKTDELGIQAVENPMNIRDLQATILHLLGLDSHELTYRYQGLNQRLIGPTDDARVHSEIFA